MDKLDQFLSEDEKKKKKKQLEDAKLIKSTDGLIERIDKKLITEDGKTLLFS